MIYVLIINNIVVNVIVAEQDFIDSILPNYDTILSFKEDAQYPGPGWSYDGINFTPPNIQTPITIDQEIAAIDSELQILDPKFNPTAIAQAQQTIQPIQGV